MKALLKKITTLLPLVFIAAAISCSTYNVSEVMSKSSEIRSLKKSGIIFRLPKSGIIKYDEYARTLQFWINSYEKINKIKIIGKTDGKLLSYPSELERFYQLSIDGVFQSYKAQGAIYQILHEKETDIRALMDKEDLDSLVIYEVEGNYSTEMQYVGFTSLITIVDKKLDILYLDNQTITLDIDEFDHDKAKNILLDSVAKRIIFCLKDIDYIEEK